MTYDPNEKPEFRVNQSSESSNGTIAIIVIALALVVGAFFFFTSNWNTSPEGQKLTQNNTALPAPVIQVPADPAPVAPPAAQTTTPPVDAPAANP